MKSESFFLAYIVAMFILIGSALVLGTGLRIRDVNTLSTACEQRGGVPIDMKGDTKVICLDPKALK